MLIQKQNRVAQFDLPLNHCTIEQLALEASVRGWTIADIIGKIVRQVMEKDLVGRILRNGDSPYKVNSCASPDNLKLRPREARGTGQLVGSLASQSAPPPRQGRSDRTAPAKCEAPCTYWKSSSLNALSLRPLARLAQDEEPGGACGAPGGRGRLRQRAKAMTGLLSPACLNNSSDQSLILSCFTACASRTARRPGSRGQQTTRSFVPHIGAPTRSCVEKSGRSGRI